MDSSKFSTEFIVSNSNTWTGESYGYQPSLQALISYDNNKNTELGLFGCFNYKSPATAFFNGADIFFVRKLSKKLSVTLDAYTYLSNKDTLADYFGYRSKMYNLYTAGLKYDFSPQFSLLIGYSVFNNSDSLQQSVSVEADFIATKSLTMIFVYSTGSDILNGKQGLIASGVGFQSGLGKWIKYGITYNPPFYDNVPSYYSSFMFMAAVNLSEEFYRFRH